MILNRDTIRKLTTAELIARKDLQKIKHGPRKPVFLILDNIRSMHNVGAIFRTADAARIAKLYLCGITAKPPRKEIEKTALKTIDFVPWEYYSSVEKLIVKLKKQKINIIALEQTNKSVDYRSHNYVAPLAIVVGNEVDGVSGCVLKLADAIVEIPMFGIANSLNVATATGVILYHLIGKNVG